MIGSAILMAVNAHHGQSDKAGAAYILHALAVMDRARHDSEAVRIVAVLHDVVEDTTITRQDIRNEFGEEISEGVDAVTRRDEETYAEFITRASRHDIGRLVKRYDVADHLRPDSGYALSPSMRKRYEDARAVLGAATRPGE